MTRDSAPPSLEVGLCRARPPVGSQCSRHLRGAAVFRAEDSPPASRTAVDERGKILCICSCVATRVCDELLPSFAWSLTVGLSLRRPAATPLRGSDAGALKLHRTRRVQAQAALELAFMRFSRTESKPADARKHKRLVIPGGFYVRPGSRQS